MRAPTSWPRSSRGWRKPASSIRAPSNAVLAVALVLAASCGGGSNLPSASRSVSLPTLPSRTPIPTRTTSPPTSEAPTRTSTSTSTSSTTSAPTKTSTSTATKTSTSTATSTSTSTSTATSPAPQTSVAGSVTLVPTATSSPVPAATSSAPVWPWILLAIAVLAAITAFVLRARSRQAAAAAVRQRALDAYADAVALHDQAAVLPMSADVDRPRMLSDVSASLDRVIGAFEALSLEPALRDASEEIRQVQLALGNLRGALQAQVEAGGIDPELLRARLADLDSTLQPYRQRLMPTAP